LIEARTDPQHIDCTGLFLIIQKEGESVAERKLTPKQQKFVAEYLIDLNATQAVIRAGYSAKTARNIANELLTKPHIQAELQKRRGKIQNKLEISQETIIAELAAIAFANGADYAKIEGEGALSHVEFTPTSKLDPMKLKAIAGIKESQSGMEVKLHDKLRAIELLDKYLGLFEQKEAAETSLADTVAEAYKRRKEADDDADD
jgi:phage terminase small subunit